MWLPDNAHDRQVEKCTARDGRHGSDVDTSRHSLSGHRGGGNMCLELRGKGCRFQFRGLSFRHLDAQELKELGKACPGVVR